MHMILFNTKEAINCCRIVTTGNDKGVSGWMMSVVFVLALRDGRTTTHDLTTAGVFWHRLLSALSSLLLNSPLASSTSSSQQRHS